MPTPPRGLSLGRSTLVRRTADLLLKRPILPRKSGQPPTMIFKGSSRCLRKLITLYKRKLEQIRHLNPKCKLFIVPVIPSRASKNTRKIGYFNHLIRNELVQYFPRLYVVSGTDELYDEQGTLAHKFDANDRTGLHLNWKGVSVVVQRIKQCIFQVKKGSRLQSNRLYSRALITGGPVDHR